LVVILLPAAKEELMQHKATEVLQAAVLAGAVLSAVL
jgi:hypothetical protein